jgi:hypothetical protein
MKKNNAELEKNLRANLTALVQSQQFDAATKLLNRTKVGDEPEGWNGSFCESLGDQFYSSDKAAADWFYSESLRWWEKFAGQATSGGDAFARASAGGPANEKLLYLRSGVGWPYKKEIPEDVVLQHFHQWAQTTPLADLAQKELEGQHWSKQCARVISFLQNERAPRDLVYQLAYIPLRLYASYHDPTGILASWLRLSLPRLVKWGMFTSEIEDNCRMLAGDKDPASEEIAGLVKDYLRAADAAPAMDAEGNRRKRSFLYSTPTSEEDLVEDLLDHARDRSVMGHRLRGMRAASPSLRIRFLSEFVDHCSADEACELIYLVVSVGLWPQEKMLGTLEKWGQVLFEAIERRKLRAPDMVRHCFQGLAGKDFPQGLRRQIVKFLLAYGSQLEDYRKIVTGSFSYDLYTAGTYHPMTRPASPKTWHEWEHEGWAKCEHDWPIAALLFALDPPEEGRMLDVLEAPLDVNKPSPMFLPSVVLFHLWTGSGVSADGLRAVARHMQIADKMESATFMYLYDRAVLVFDKWYPLQPAIDDPELRRAATQVAREIKKLEAQLGPRPA